MHSGEEQRVENYAKGRAKITLEHAVEEETKNEFLGDRRDAIIEDYSRRLPVKRPGRPEEIADAVLFLMKNEFVTGITLTVDGGGVLT